MRVILDTNAYSAFKRGDEAIVELVASADTVLIPAIVLGELRAGFRTGSKEETNLLELEAFLSSPRVQVASVGEETAIRYAEVFGSLKAAGKPIPANDLWIAASVLETGAVLLSRDAHFDYVPGILRK